MLILISIERKEKTIMNKLMTHDTSIYIYIYIYISSLKNFNSTYFDNDIRYIETSTDLMK